MLLQVKSPVGHGAVSEEFFNGLDSLFIINIKGDEVTHWVIYAFCEELHALNHIIIMEDRSD